MTVGVYWFYQSSRDAAIYIGSSVQVEVRKQQHVNELNQGKHKNTTFQKMWNKYGERDFEFKLLEEVDKGILKDREQYWLDALSPESNIALRVDDNPRRGVGLSDLHKSRISAALKGRKPSDKAYKASKEKWADPKYKDEVIQRLKVWHKSIGHMGTTIKYVKKNNRAEAKAKDWKSKEFRELQLKNNPGFRGKKHTAEALRIMSDKAKQREAIKKSKRELNSKSVVNSNESDADKD